MAEMNGAACSDKRVCLLGITAIIKTVVVIIITCSAGAHTQGLLHPMQRLSH